MGLKVEHLFAFVVVDPEDGNEGVIGFQNSDGDMMPMIGADIARVKSLIPIADNIAKQTGIDYEIRYFVLDSAYSGESDKDKH